MDPDGRTDGRTEWTDERTEGLTDAAKTKSLRLRRGIITLTNLSKKLEDLACLSISFYLRKLNYLP